MQVLPGHILKALPLLDDEIKLRIYQHVAFIMIQIAHLPPWSRIGLIQEVTASSINTFTICNMRFPIPNLAKQPALSSARSYFNMAAKVFWSAS